MGADSSALRGFSLQEPAWTLPSGLSIHPALLRDGRLCTVFIYQPDNQDKVNKAAQHLKTLRHPCLLRFLSCTVEEDGIHLITERVQPLEMVLDSLSSDEICAGIYDILQALVFFHDTGNSAHNNVCLSSVFVSEDGHWKLGGMEMVSKLTDAPPEFAEFGILPEAHGHARDAYSFGKMVDGLLAHLTDPVSSDLISRFRCTLNSTLLNPDPTCRPPLSSLLSNEFFRNDFLEVVNFLKHLTVKTEEEKSEFFKFLLDRVCGLSEELIISRLVPLLLNQLVFAEPVAIKSFLPYLLRPKKETSGKRHSDCLLSPALFQARVIPLLLKLFKVHEEHVRMVLLTHIDAYGGLFSKEELKNEILPQVLLGLRDINDSMVAMTLHSLAVLVSLLGPEVVIGGDRTKIFKSTTPSFAKAADTTPEDSPVHMNHIMQINQPMKHYFGNVFSKSSLSKYELVTSKVSQKYSVQEEEILTSISKENDLLPVLTLSMNAVSSSPEQMLKREDMLSNSIKTTEEWPDWSESEDLRGESTVKIHLGPSENGVDLEKKPEQNMEEEPWVDFESSSKDIKIVLDQVSLNESWSAASQLVKGSDAMTTKSSTDPNELNSLPGSNNDLIDHENQHDETNKTVVKTSKVFQEKAFDKKKSMEFGLGEEFTIQVKRKSQDPELDWFADMVPDIKSFSASLILPSLTTELNVVDNLKAVSSIHNQDKGSDGQSLGFSSKFAADEITETEAEGWGGADLNWDDDESLW
ncbi:protein-associating with the carboxyl-terminal domain of ezrin [Ambystoma mexicanum]|uniref:protein-associating with the carboxyl-terminal domain of ezrin n=1 Tax=Ambystoma mexicanum TaxID=8296 RepID=UPI0037E76E26